MANVYQSVLGGGGVTPTSITPSNSSPVALTANTPVNPTAAGYAIESYDSKTPDDDTPPTVASGDIVKMGGAGYLYASQQSSGGVGGIVTGVAKDTEYIIDTGLSSIRSFCAYQSNLTGGSSASGNAVSVYTPDISPSNYFLRCANVSGVANGVYYNTFSDTMANNSIGLFIRGVSGGKVTVHTGKYNAALNSQDIRWIAY